MTETVTPACTQPAVKCLARWPHWLWLMCRESARRKPRRHLCRPCASRMRRARKRTPITRFKMACFKNIASKSKGTKFDSGPALIAALVAGSVDVGYFGLPAVINANGNGAKLQVFSIANTSGKTSALYVNPKNIRFLDPNALVAGYAQGDLDAVWMFAAFGARMVSNGAVLLPSTSAEAIGLDDPGNFVANPDFISKNKKHFRASWQLSMRRLPSPMVAWRSHSPRSRRALALSVTRRRSFSATALRPD